ncbi:MAG: hypothetical protein EXR43_04205 [Dehalococcoidia bacterium]|nr:hypothetical protein [Dehalococcoidia bacterium]
MTLLQPFARHARHAGSAGLAIAIAFAALLGGCGDEAPSTPPSGVTQPRFSAAMQALCRTQGLAEAGDVAEARRVFEDAAHGFLHELATRVSEDDRDATARLLIAKNRVEAALAAPPPDGGKSPGPLIGALIAATADAGESIGLSFPGCRPGGR